MNHPCSKWLRESKDNYIWLCSLGLALCNEKIYRWEKNKAHACIGHLEVLSKNIPNGLQSNGLTKFALAMPDECKESDPVESYKNYYNSHKQRMFKWTKRNKPMWIIDI